MAMARPDPEALAPRWRAALAARRARLGPPPRPLVQGRLVRMVGLTLEAVGCEAPVGGRCDRAAGGARE